MKLWQRILVGAVVGAIGGFTADADAASNHPDPWNWRVALRRALYGALTGVATTLTGGALVSGGN